MPTNSANPGRVASRDIQACTAGSATRSMGAFSHRCADKLVAGEVTCEEADYSALYRHADKLDTLTRKLGLTPFQSLCDLTDVRFNMDQLKLPEGMTSTTELMAVQGAWVDTTQAVTMLQSLRQHIVDHKVRFGLLSNQHDEVVQELGAALAFAKTQVATAPKFNFVVVM
ncbi:MAG: hypothetical protein EKK53_05480 [Burkholderiales bacterium]|nr:MAG: hypothetical protein EKK53_05480 [Burkholderiales bacterium]